MKNKKAVTNTKKEEAGEMKDALVKNVKPSLVLGPRVTEKSAMASERGAYTFNVKNTANKTEIKKAIKAMYGVSPIKVSVTQIQDKNVARQGVFGIKQGGKKATVYLKKGDKIAFT